jgi:mitochondrial fission protein ELM1
MTQRSHAGAEAAPRPYPLSDEQPSIWLLLADKHGDNGQAEAVARALEQRLGWTCERKEVRFVERWATAKPDVEPSLHHVDSARSDSLVPPWPDVVITIGRRPSMVALWIRTQSRGRTRIVLIGKPSSPVQDYDLVVASAEVLLPPLENVLAIDLPLMEIDKGAVAAAAERWRPELRDVPRPITAILVGGPTQPYVFDENVADRIVAVAERIASEHGSPCVVTSRRTPATVADRLGERLPAAARFFRWSSDTARNPYRALLDLADAFVVTADSISMIVEVVRAGKPLEIFPLPMTARGALSTIRRTMIGWLLRPTVEGRVSALRRSVAVWGNELGIVGPSRDLRAFHRLLFRRGLAAPLGTRPPRKGSAGDDLGAVIERIRRLAGGPMGRIDAPPHAAPAAHRV